MTTKKVKKIRSDFKKKVKIAKKLYKKGNITWKDAIQKAFSK